MKISQTDTRQEFKSAARRGLACLLIVLTGLGAIIAHTLTKQRRASGEIVLELCKKDANGQWKVIDRAKGTLTLSASVLDLAERKEFKSNLNWEPRSEQGHQISVKESGPGKAIVNTATGEVTLETPYSVTVDGRSLSFTAKLTNKSISTPLGTLSGKKLEINGTSLSAGVVGYIEIKEKSVIDLLLKEPIRSPVVLDKKGVKEPAAAPAVKDKNDLPNNGAIANKSAESLIVVIRAQGSSKE
jgi:hypothetical protein